MMATIIQLQHIKMHLRPYNAIYVVLWAKSKPDYNHNASLPNGLSQVNFLKIMVFLVHVTYGLHYK